MAQEVRKIRLDADLPQFIRLKPAGADEIRQFGPGDCVELEKTIASEIVGSGRAVYLDADEAKDAKLAKGIDGREAPPLSRAQEAERAKALRAAEIAGADVAVAAGDQGGTKSKGGK